MTTKLIKDIKKGLGQLTKIIESLSGSIEEADIQEPDVVLRGYRCRYEKCDRSYGHESSRANHERKEHGKTWPQRRRKDDE